MNQLVSINTLLGNKLFYEIITRKYSKIYFADTKNLCILIGVTSLGLKIICIVSDFTNPFGVSKHERVLKDIPGNFISSSRSEYIADEHDNVAGAMRTADQCLAPTIVGAISKFPPRLAIEHKWFLSLSSTESSLILRSVNSFAEEFACFFLLKLFPQSHVHYSHFANPINTVNKFVWFPLRFLLRLIWEIDAQTSCKKRRK